MEEMMPVEHSELLDALGKAVASAASDRGVRCNYLVEERDAFAKSAVPGVVLDNLADSRVLSYWLEDSLLAYVFLRHGGLEYEVDIVRAFAESEAGYAWFTELLTGELNTGRRFGVMGARYVVTKAGGPRLYSC